MKTTLLKSTLFTLCMLLAAGVFAQVQVGGSYLNISRPSGGPVSTNDVLEIHAVISIPSGTTVANLVYTDAVPAGTTFQSGSLKVVTNEDVILGSIPNTGSYTDASGDDRGQISGSNITIYMGNGATSSSGGTVVGGTTTPVFYNTASILMAAYRVTVTASAGTVISLAGKFTYTSGGNQTLNLPVNTINVSTAYGCASNLAVNLISSETNGTFSSGTAQNRGASANVSGFTYMNITTGNPADGQYAVVKNTSPTQYTGASPASSDKVFGVWDIIGDHTGTSNSAGNAPAANGANKGYMLAVNASYAPASVFSTTISGLLINTGYTFSFWLRNICGNCGANPASNAASGTPGVQPNLAFEVNGNDYYSTGDIAYTGGWVQKSFNFNSGSSTSITINIKNNAPGGGGNDWVIDDLSLTQCVSLLPLTLTDFTAVKQNNVIALRWKTENEVNVSHYEVERSTDGTAFTKAGIVYSNKTQSSNTYSFDDASALSAPQYFYRLRMVDMDGHSSYSNIVSIKNALLQANGLVIAPNPAATGTTIYLTSETSGNSIIEIYNMAGAKMFSRNADIVKGQNNIPLNNIGSFSKGMYIIKVIVNNTTYNSKLLVD